MRKDEKQCKNKQEQEKKQKGKKTGDAMVVVVCLRMSNDRQAGVAGTSGCTTAMHDGMKDLFSAVCVHVFA